MAEVTLNDVSLKDPKIILKEVKTPFDRLWAGVGGRLKPLSSYLGYEEMRWMESGKRLCRLLDRVEKVPCLFSSEMAPLEHQKAYYAACIETAKCVKAGLKGLHNPQAQAEARRLAARIASLKYRIEEANGGNAPSAADPKMVEKLTELAAQWKQKVVIFPDKQLSARDLKKLTELSTYPKFAKALIADAELRERFFSWAIRDNNGVRQFVEFPATSARIKSVFLAARVGRFGGDMLHIEKRPKEGSDTVSEKVITLPFYLNGQKTFVSIMDESKELTFGTGRQETIRSVFEVFAQKNRRVGDFEFFGSRGIDEWNMHELGRYNQVTKQYDRIDLSKEKWWLQLPVIDEIDKQTLEKRYHVALAEGEWLVCGKASRESPDLDLDKTHGFMEIAIPCANGKYQIFPIGNLAVNFPYTLIELLAFLANTDQGRIAYPDENYYYPHRQIATYPMKWSEEKGLRLMRKIQIDMIKARYGAIIFQFAGDNCAYWSQSTLQDVDPTVPNLYIMKLRDAMPRNAFLQRVFNTFRRAPDWVQPSLFKALDVAFWSHRGVTVYENGQEFFKSHKGNDCRQKTLMYHPGFLHEQILQGKLPGVVTAGN